VNEEVLKAEKRDEIEIKKQSKTARQLYENIEITRSHPKINIELISQIIYASNCHYS
jgi:type III secretory pathway component EscU